MSRATIRLKRMLLAMAAAGAVLAPMTMAQQTPQTPPAPGGRADNGPAPRGAGEQGSGDHGQGDQGPGDRGLGDRGPRDQGPGEREPGRRPPPPKPVPVAGKVLQYNHGPRGEVEGVILQSQDKIVQINTPPGLGSLLTTIAPIGKDVKLLGRTAPPPRNGRTPPPDGQKPPAADHEVYEFAGIDDGTQPPEPPAPGTDAPADTNVEGTVVALNYGRRGEVNGAVLDTGDFIAVGPREAAQLKLAVGQKITASGDATPMADGHKAIGAKEVNGQAVRQPKPMGERGPRPDGDKGPPPPPPGN